MRVFVLDFGSNPDPKSLGTSLREFMKATSSFSTSNEGAKKEVLQKREAGGPLVPGQPYLVGESGPETAMVGGEVKTVGVNGPEIIKPDAAGMVVPNSSPLSKLLKGALDFLVPSAEAAETQQMKPGMWTQIQGQTAAKRGEFDDQQMAEGAKARAAAAGAPVSELVKGTVNQSMNRDERAQANVIARQKLAKMLEQVRHLTPAQAAAEAARQIP